MPARRFAPFGCTTGAAGHRGAGRQAANVGRRASMQAQACLRATAHARRARTSRCTDVRQLSDARSEAAWRFPTNGTVTRDYRGGHLSASVQQSRRTGHACSPRQNGRTARSTVCTKRRSQLWPESRTKPNDLHIVSSRSAQTFGGERSDALRDGYVQSCVQAASTQRPRRAMTVARHDIARYSTATWVASSSASPAYRVSRRTWQVTIALLREAASGMDAGRSYVEARHLRTSFISLATAIAPHAAGTFHPRDEPPTPCIVPLVVPTFSASSRPMVADASSSGEHR